MTKAVKPIWGDISKEITITCYGSGVIGIGNVPKPHSQGRSVQSGLEPESDELPLLSGAGDFKLGIQNFVMTEEQCN